MPTNPELEKKKAEEQAMMERWSIALEADGGIADEYVARQTAIVLENYWKFLKKHPILMAEDKVTTSQFSGVNLALIGVIRRVIPAIVGQQLVGMQAKPTPDSKVFTMVPSRGDSKNSVLDGQEIWNHPIPSKPSGSAGILGEDFGYSSNVVQETINVGAPTVANEPEASGDFQFAAGVVSKDFYWAKQGNKQKDGIAPQYSLILNNTVSMQVVGVANDAYNGKILQAVTFPGSYYGSGTIAAVNAMTAKLTTPLTALTGAVVTKTGSTIANVPTLDYTQPASLTGVAVAAAYQIGGLATTDVAIVLSYEVSMEGNVNQPELGLRIDGADTGIIKRMLRGRYTLDAAFDMNVLHGIDLESELVNLMKLDITNGINREIVDDLRKMAAINQVLDFNAYVSPTPSNGTVISGNYEDTHRLLLDSIHQVAAKIWNLGRLGKGNFVVGNPVTLAFLSRVSGFSGSGVTANASGLTYTGSLGGNLKFYEDPQYPAGELLIGYKGQGAMDAGYLHCPYLPVTATPTMNQVETGDPIKIFYTRYGKTYRAFNPKNGKANDNVIYAGEYQYARLSLKNLPLVLS